MKKKKKLKNDVRSLNACNAFLIKRAFNRIAFQFASGTTLRTNRTIHRCFVFSPRSSKARSMQRSHVGSKMYVKRGRCLCSQWICATTNEGGGEVAFGANPTASALLQTRKCSRQRENKKKKGKSRCRQHLLNNRDAVEISAGQFRTKRRNPSFGGGEMGGGRPPHEHSPLSLTNLTRFCRDRSGLFLFRSSRISPH